MTAPTRAETAALREARERSSRIAPQADRHQPLSQDDIYWMVSVLPEILVQRDRARAENALREAQVRILSDQRSAAEAEPAALKARIAALEVALRPFADCWTPLLNHYDQRGTPGWSAMGTVRIVDLKLAHDELARTDLEGTGHADAS